MKLYITRHGETMRNAEYRVLGRTDDPLSEKGRAQARELAENLKDVEIDLIFSSPLGRAKETAETVAKTKGLEVIEDERLLEINFGEFEGVSGGTEAYQSAKREFFKRYPSGESYFDIAYRVYDFLYMLKREYPEKRVLVVSHGGVCRILHNYFIGMENEEFAKFAFPNCGIEEFDF